MRTILLLALPFIYVLVGSHCNSATLDSSKAEMIGRVEYFFMNNFRDVTARKSLEWGDIEADKNGNSSIRYKYNAIIWDNETMVMNQIFTFGPEGKFVKAENVGGFPKKN